ARRRPRIQAKPTTTIIRRVSEPDQQPEFSGSMSKGLEPKRRRPRAESLTRYR
ncbi:hypothetical protein HAX54_034579, partial [Datura stramonium]|nr:hypothetical protein [Datura stramonium]